MQPGKKLLFCDLDGTLLDDRKQIREQDLTMIQKMLAAGHIFVICTGRPLESGAIIAKRYQLSQWSACYIIGYNGGKVYAPAADKYIHSETVPLVYIRKLFEKAKEAGLHIQTYDKDDTVLAIKKTPELETYMKNTNLPYKTGEACIRKLSQDPAKAIVASLTDHEALVRFQEENACWTDSAMTSFFSCEEYLEYCPLGASKGNAIRILCEYLKLPLSDTVAAGDERNDIPMLETAAIGVVPSNAHPKAKAAADYICERDNNHGAIAELIQKFIL